MVYYHLGLFMPRVQAGNAVRHLSGQYSFGDDFYPVWLSSRECIRASCDPYSEDTTRAIQKGLFGRPLDEHNLGDPVADYRTFAYPAFTDLLFWPLAMIDFPALRLLLAVLLPGLTIAGIAFWLRALDWKVGWIPFVIIVLLTLCTYELLEAFFAEQPGLFVGFFLAGGALALRRNRLPLAGALMALTLIKPQMTLLSIGYLFLWSLTSSPRLRFWIGFLAIAIPLMAASVWLWPRWLGQWLAIVHGYHRYAMPPLIMVLLGEHLGRYLGPIFIAAALAAGMAVAWRNRRAGADAPRFWFTLSLLLAITSVAILPGQAIYDHIILIPGILLVVRYRQHLRSAGRVPRVLLAVGALVLVWPWISAFALITLRPMLPAIDSSTDLFTLPIRSAAPLPFAALALIAYAMSAIPLRDQEAV